MALVVTSPFPIDGKFFSPGMVISDKAEIAKVQKNPMLAGKYVAIADGNPPSQEPMNWGPPQPVAPVPEPVQPAPAEMPAPPELPKEEGK